MAKWLWATLFCSLVTASQCGCAGVSLAAAGTVAGIAATALTTGTDVYSNGKLDSAELVVDPEDWLAATRLAAGDLRLSLVAQERNKPGRWHMHYEDNQRAPVKMTIEARSPTLVRCRIDVGLWGNEPTARLMLSRIRMYVTPVPKPTTRPGVERVETDETTGDVSVVPSLLTRTRIDRFLKS